MLCIRGTSHGPVSVCLSVCLCLSQAGVLLKRQNVGSHTHNTTRSRRSSCVYHLYTDDLLWRNFLSPQCRNCSRDPDHAHPRDSSFLMPIKDLREIRPGSPPTRAPNASGVVKIGDFRQITGYISKTVKDRHIVSIKVE